MFKQLGFIKTTSAVHETGYERVVVYEQDGEYTHAARQLPSGKWVSKMGALEDIEHDTLEGLVGADTVRCTSSCGESVTNKRDPNIDIPGQDEFSNFDRLFQKVIVVPPRAAIKEDPKKPVKKKPGRSKLAGAT